MHANRPVKTGKHVRRVRQGTCPVLMHSCNQILLSVNGTTFFAQGHRVCVTPCSPYKTAAARCDAAARQHRLILISENLVAWTVPNDGLTQSLVPVFVSEL